MIICNVLSKFVHKKKCCDLFRKCCFFLLNIYLKEFTLLYEEMLRFGCKIIASNDIITNLTEHSQFLNSRGFFRLFCKNLNAIVYNYIYMLYANDEPRGGLGHKGSTLNYRI